MVMIKINKRIENLNIYLPGIYLFKINKGKSRLMCELENDVIDVVLVSLLLTLNRFHTLFWCFCC